MKLFLSWSGDRSKALAEAFDKWIQSVVQAVTPFFSPDDIEKGSFWFQEINENLKEAKTGIMFITQENRDRPWMLFEAGALATKIGKPRLIPLLFDMQPSELTGPLANLNVAVFNKDEIKKVVMTINGQVEEQRLDPAVLDSVFEKWWPDLDDAVATILSQEDHKISPSRPTEDILEELLALGRLTREYLYSIEQQWELLAEDREAPFVHKLHYRYPKHIVHQALGSIPMKYREPVILLDFEAVTMKAASELIQASPATVRSRASIGRQMLKESLLELKMNVNRERLAVSANEDSQTSDEEE
ncbi:MAG: TIR domain-containing protein [Fimbriimonadaceae bacterium]|nr:TIR domain-containing protein [Fimbriimonadaceae bacterium]